MKQKFQNLKTPFAKNAKDAWSIYPRPQMQRASYLPLCGDWSFYVRKSNACIPLGKINVPFPPESMLSGIMRTPEKHGKYLYKKIFTVEKAFLDERVLLHFGAVDQIARVTLNGNCLGEHVGGYLPFSFDVTDAVHCGENELCVEVTDEIDTDIPYGKQRHDRGGMWYTPISGIWQTVWMESVPTEYLRHLRITPTVNSVTIVCEGGADEKLLQIETPHGTETYRFTGDTITVTVKEPRLWTPETPYLYYFSLTSGKDTVRSYFALRTITVGRANGRDLLLLNGKPYFFHGLLDQGYFSDGIYLPASPDGFRYDIETMKSLGFNTLRKHIKIEPECFYYDCDRLGMIVFQDMVNSGPYHFLIDTALPTVGLKRGISHHASPRRREIFESHARETVTHLYNHPCVCYYTVFNEGWGQYDADRIYGELRTLDPTRIYDATSGWFTKKESDVRSEHIYFKKLRFKDGNRPLVLSEFGGYSCKLPQHAFNLDKTYGYRFFETEEQLQDALEHLYLDEVIPAIREKGLCAAILTQVSDVEDETNGLVTYDRRRVKVSPERMQRIADALYKTFGECFG
ncbi:MAG: glycoside hydrolase family 2 [Clostridia bacterium]|nr:glycoside hydrolase family 2 [Clostridia bacterium]